MPKKENYKFFNLPKKFDLEDYKNAIDGIVKKYSDTPGLLSIYNWGNPSVPGISDIDIVLVFKANTGGHLPILKRSFYFLDGNTRYLVAHPFMFIDEKSFEDIRYIYPDANLELLHGKKIKIKNLSSDEKYYAGIALLNDIIIRHYPRDFIVQSISRKINARDTLLRLNSLKYTVKVLENIKGNKNNEHNRFVSEVEKLRKNWLKHEDFDSLILLNKEAVKISMDIIEDFKIFLTENKINKIISSGGNSLRYNGLKNKTLFIYGWNRKKSLDEMAKAAKSKKKFYSVLPIELSAQLIEYSKYDGVISKYIKNNLSKTIS